MADVTISSLPAVTSPNTSLQLPVTDGTTTRRMTVSQILGLQSGVPIGTIVMWSNYNGAGIPSGWALCDGQAGRPDLRNRFVVGSGSSYSIGNTGGSADAIVVSHTHGVTDPGHSHSYTGDPTGGTFGTTGQQQRRPAASNTNSVTTGISINPQGSSGTNANLPPYYALAFIIKIS